MKENFEQYGIFSNKHAGMPVRESWGSKEAQAGRAGATALLKGDYSTEALRLISGHTSHSR